MSQTRKNRVEYVDLFRGIGILLMVMGHIGFGELFDHYIHAFHMPMFFFASGYFFKRKQAIDTFTTSKLKTLIVPYLLCTVVIYALWKLFYDLPDESLIYVLAYMNTTGFIAAALWFLTALFFANFVYWALDHFITYEWIMNGGVIAIALSGSLLHLLYKKPCIFAIDAAMVGVGMMHAGFLFKKNNKIASRMVNMSWPMLIIGLAINGILIILNSPVNMRLGDYGVIPLFWLNAIGSSILLWILSFKIDKLSIKNRVSSGIISLLKKIGKRSLTFLCLNQVVIHYVFEIIPAGKSGGMWALLHNVASLVLVLSILYVVAFAVEMAKNRILK